MPRRVHHNEIETFLQEVASIGANLAVVEGTDDGECNLPGGASAANFVGITKYAGSATAGDPIEVITDGCCDVVVDATTDIARGDWLEIAGTSGKLSKSAMTNGKQIVARALEAATADGDVIAVRITPFVMPAS